jgi:hypothetical protein
LHTGVRRVLNDRDGEGRKTLVARPTARTRRGRAHDEDHEHMEQQRQQQECRQRTVPPGTAPAAQSGYGWRGSGRE